MEHQEVINLYDEYILNTYTRANLVMTKAKGSWVWGANGRVYLDFFPGWAVSGLGHCHPRVVKAIRQQAKRIIHVSNNYYHQPQARLAERISLNSFGGKVFFCNSGAEANETAFKVARAFGNPQRYEIISMDNSFHGRTLACVAATGQAKYRKGFDPIPEGFKIIPFNDQKALTEAISEKTVAIILELIQGEGGINVADKDYIKYARDLCTKNNLLLIIDEVQTGMGRTGKLFCYQNYAVEPDVMTLAKSLGGGMPIGVTVVQKKIANILHPGMHASTFGGSPIVCAASLAVFDAIEKERLLKNVEKMGSYLQQELLKLKDQQPVIKDVRGMGLMLGVELLMNAPRAYEYCLQKGLLINCTQGNTLRIMPPLNVTKPEVNQALEILREAISRC